MLEEDNVITKTFTYEYGNKAGYPGWGYASFINWNTLTDVDKGYMSENGDITCQIIVNTGPVKRAPVEKLRFPKAAFTHMYSDVGDMTVGTTKFSKTIMYLHDFPWKMKIERKGTSLAFYVYCNDGDKSEWSCKANIECKLLPMKEGVNAISKTFTYEFGNKSKYPGYGFHEFIDWNDLVDINKGYISENSEIICQAVVNSCLTNVL